MKIIRYATARLIYYKKQTILYCLFSSFSAFLLIACLTLYHLQSALANQVQDRLSFIGASASTELLPALELASRFYIKGIFSLFFLFAFLFIFFFYYSVRQNKQELINWHLTGLSKTKLFLFIFWQLFFPLFLCCILVLLWIVSFQSVYEALLQRINFLVLKTTELPDIRDILTSVSGLTIPMDQQTFFTIDFQNDLFFTDILKDLPKLLLGSVDAVSFLVYSLSLFLSIICKVGGLDVMKPEYLIHAEHLTVILCPLEKQHKILEHLKKEVLVAKLDNFAIIQKNWPMFPYLNLKDHVLLDVPEKEIKQDRLAYQEKLDISPSLLNCAAAELTSFEKVKLQLLHALLSKRNNIVIEDTFDELSVLEIQELLHLLSYLAHEENQGILLFTHDATIAQSPYIDRLEPAG